jgi:hypothetical protein
VVKKSESDVVVAMDGEVFGHHYDDGIYLLEQVLDKILDKDMQIVTVGKIVEDSAPRKLDDFLESSWGASDEDMGNARPFPLWDAEENEVQKLLWDLQSLVINEIKVENVETNIEGYESLPVWNLEDVKKIQNGKLAKETMLSVVLSKSLHSDQFWWVSNKEILGRRLYEPKMVKRALGLYKLVAEMYGDEKLISDVNTLSAKIESTL